MAVEALALCPFGIEEGVVSKAAELCPGRARALVPAGEESRAAMCGADAVSVLEARTVYDEVAFADYLAERIARWGSGIILAPATVQMRNIMPALAWKLHAGLTADCTALSMRDGVLLQTRPALGNSVVADIRAHSAIQMATVRPGTLSPKKRKRTCTELERMVYREAGERVRCLSLIRSVQGRTPTRAKIVVAGGMGVGSLKGFQKLERLADRLGAGLGASRTAVNAGFAPYCCQVGMTGVTVHPKLYIAIGISGAAHHLAGMATSEKVVAVNSDPRAPIFDYADYGIVGHWEEVVDELLEGSTYEL